MMGKIPLSILQIKERKVVRLPIIRFVNLFCDLGRFLSLSNMSPMRILWEEVSILVCDSEKIISSR